MKPQLALAFVVATAPAALAQTAGIAPLPQSAPAAIPHSKPSAAIPDDSVVMQAAAATVAKPAEEEFKPYRPYGAPAVELHTRAANDPAADPDAGIVTEVAHRPNELPIGTAIRARLRSTIATESTQPDTPFTAELSENVYDGTRLVLPSGSTVEGVVTQVRGGRRFRGTALIHLQAQRVVLPDGTSMPLHAQVVDTDQFAETSIDSEGNIIRKDHAGATLAAVSLATGSGAAAGAVFGGGFGALIGAGIGAGLSTAVWLKADRQAHLPQDTLVVFSLTDTMDLKQRPDFVAVPPAKPASTTATAVAPQPVPQAPAYVAPQSFVPTN